MWQWWNGLISGNTPTLVNPDKNKLIKRSFENVIRFSRAKLKNALWRPGVLNQEVEEKFFVVDNFLHELLENEQLALPITSEKFNELKEEVLTKINFGKAHTYVLEKSLGNLEKGFLNLNIISTSPEASLVLDEYLSEKQKENHVLCEFTVFITAQKKEKSTVAISFGTNEMVFIGLPKDGICFYLQLLLDNFIDLLSVNPKSA